ncbi:MAG: hypothetical protein HY906_11595 [Deltaproteobacteria bacterium]|nr:hypothetical protein [Deltaproteobacteria bacterium]
MRGLTLGDVKLGIHDLLDKRRPTLISTSIGKTYAPMLDQKQAEIDALPASAIAGETPLARELLATDGLHDGFGYSIYYLSRAYEELPEATPALKAAAVRLREALVPRLGELRRTYPDEAAAAMVRHAELPKYEADLKQFPVAGGKTLLDWATAYVGHGEHLHELLTARADATAAPDGKTRAEAARLRSSTIGLLGRLREALKDEVAADQSLPRDLDTKLFGYFDELQAIRQR